MILTTHILLAFMMIAVSYFFKTYQPEKINRWYGYRTKLSMKNIDTWKEGNRYSSDLQIKSTLAFIIFATLSYCLVGGLHSLLISCGILTVTSIAVIPLTEHHLKKTFDKNGNRLDEQTGVSDTNSRLEL